MKIPKLFKKAAAFVMAAVTALSIMPATAFAAGDIGTISFSHTYDSNGNAMRYNSSANIGGYTAGGTGNYKYRMFVDGIRATEIICREVMMKNGLPRRPSYGSLSQVAVKPQVHITRQAPPFTACTSVQIMPTAEQGQCMTRLLQCCVSITPFRALCRAVRMTSQRSLPTRTESTASH